LNNLEKSKIHQKLIFTALVCSPPSNYDELILHFFIAFHYYFYLF